MDKISYIDFDEANELDKRLMSCEIGYTLEQLMELAGYSVSKCVCHIVEKYRPAKRILIVCGPGNNGGDGLVAARHLTNFGFNVKVFYPKMGKNPFFQNLIKQLKAYNVEICDVLTQEEYGDFDLILDAIFGFGLRGDIREPYSSIIDNLSKFTNKIISIDVPSGSYLDNVEYTNGKFMDFPCNISLCVPKKSVENFKGLHFLAGRFLPPIVSDVVLPLYGGSSEFTLLPQLD